MRSPRSAPHGVDAACASITVEDGGATRVYLPTVAGMRRMMRAQAAPHLLMLVAYIVWQLMMLLLPGFRRDMGELLGPSPDGHVPSSVPLIGGSSLSSLAVWTVSSALLALPALLGAVELIGDLERYNVLATWARGRDPYHGMDWPPRDPIERVYYNRRLYKCLSRLTPWDCHQVSIQLAAAYRQPRRALPPNETLSS